MTEIRILIVDGRTQTLDNLRRLVQIEEDMDVVGATSSAKEAIQIVEERNPYVILMGGKLPDMSGIEAAEALKNRDLFVQIVLLAVEPGTDLMRKAMRARIREVIPAPPQAESLYDALRAAHAHYLDLKSKIRPPVSTPEDSVAKHQGDVVAIFSGKGGVGCTTIATNLAVKLHDKEKPAVLVDADMQQSDVTVFLNLDPRHTIADLVPFDQQAAVELLEQVLLEHDTGLRILAAPRSLIQADSVSADDFRQILGQLRRH